MSGPADFEHELFGGGAFLRSLRRCGLLRADRSDQARRALIMVLITWAPLALLTLAQGKFLSAPIADSFLTDLAVHARFLIAAPLLVFAESLLAPRLGDVIRHFLDVNAVRDEDRDDFNEAVASTRRLVHSPPAEIVTIAIAYLIITGLALTTPPQILPGWQLSNRAADQLSWAGWWHVFVSLPVLLAAFLGMLWRWCLWVRLLWRISRMRLALVPAHPDGVAGLKFVSYSARAFTPYCFLLGVIFAASLANRVIYHGASPLAHRDAVQGLLVFVIVLFHGPFLVFTPTLRRAWRQGIFNYDALADRLGRHFEARWTDPGVEVDRSALEREDFTATTDMYSIVENVYKMRLFLFDVQGVLLIVFATAAPFAPLLVLAIPLDVVLRRVVELMV